LVATRGHDRAIVRSVLIELWTLPSMAYDYSLND
jgi:hypothetical protein